jgi:hypothetical protein
MRDKGIDKGSIRYFDDSHRNARGLEKNFFGFRKMFRDYHVKLNVPFYDACCPALTGDIYPVRFNAGTSSLERFNGTTWVAADDTVSSIQTGLTAFAGGGQGSAVALTAGFNEVGTAATAGDSVKLPTAVAGTTVTVKNDGATAIDVFPFLGDTINDGSANTAVRVAPQSTVSFVAINATNWEADNQVISTNTISEQTSAAGVTIDSVLLKDGGVSNSGATMFAGFFPTTAAQALTGAGAINVTAFLTKFTSSGAAQALTLAAGTQTRCRWWFRCINSYICRWYDHNFHYSR